MERNRAEGSGLLTFLLFWLGYRGNAGYFCSKPEHFANHTRMTLFHCCFNRSIK